MEKEHIHPEYPHVAISTDTRKIWKETYMISYLRIGDKKLAVPVVTRYMWDKVSPEDEARNKKQISDILLSVHMIAREHIAHNARSMLDKLVHTGVISEWKHTAANINTGFSNLKPLASEKNILIDNEKFLEIFGFPTYLDDRRMYVDATEFAKNIWISQWRPMIWVYANWIKSIVPDIVSRIEFAKNK
jgi:hypothetical protein